MQIRAAATTAATLLITLTLAGCTSSGGPVTTALGSSAPIASVAPTSPAPTSAAPPPPSASPTPSEPSVTQLNQQVTQAKITVKGASLSGQDRSGTPPLDICGGRLDAYNLVKAVDAWQWLGTGIPQLKEAIFGFQSLTGAEVVAQTKALATSCKSHDLTIGFEELKITGTGPMREAAPAGVDGFYAFCETQTIVKPAGLASGGAINFCTAVLSRDHLAVFLSAGGGPLSGVHQVIAKYLPITAKALIAAVG